MFRHLLVFLFGLSLVALVGCGGEKDDIKTIPAGGGAPATKAPPPMLRPGGGGDNQGATDN
jgi:hypothetical protein